MRWLTSTFVDLFSRYVEVSFFLGVYGKIRIPNIYVHHYLWRFCNSEGHIYPNRLKPHLIFCAQYHLHTLEVQDQTENGVQDHPCKGFPCTNARGKVCFFLGTDRNHADLPLKQQLFPETGVYRFMFLDFFFTGRNIPSWKFVLACCSTLAGKKRHVKTCNLFCSQVGMWVKVRHQAGQQKSLDFSSSSRQTINRSALAPLFLGNSKI